MRAIRIFAHLLLDGVVSPESQDGNYSNGGWPANSESPAGAAMLAEAYGTSDDLLLGRRTDDLWSQVWP